MYKVIANACKVYEGTLAGATKVAKKYDKNGVLVTLEDSKGNLVNF